jgi:hypothetical protein
MVQLGRLSGQRRREDLRKRQEQAFQDFVLMGPNRSLNRLHAYYKALAERIGPEQVPTLSRQKLFAWAREGNWEEKAKARDLAIRAETLSTLAESRKAAVAELSHLLGMAVTVVHRILEDLTVPAHVQLQAAKLVFELANVGAKGAESEPEPARELPAPPSPEANVVEFEEYLRKLVQSR